MGALAYARTAHVCDAAQRGEVPVLYMNGWDVFEALPQLWEPAIEQIPGTIDNGTAREYKRLGAQWHVADPKDVAERCRRLCKLFVGPVGAITRMATASPSSWEVDDAACWRG